MKHADVVQNPESAALRRYNQILSMHLDIGDRDIWQVQLKWLPVPAVVERDKHPELRPGVKQTLAIRIFAHHARRPIGRYPVLTISQPPPGLAIVVGLVDVRLVVSKQPAIHRKVG